MAGIQYGYALNQFKVQESDLVQRPPKETVLKIVSVCGFRGVEMTSDALGGPSQIESTFGSVHNFADFLHSCGIDCVCSFFGSSGGPGGGFGGLPGASGGGSPANAQERTIEAMRPIAAFLHDLGGSCLVVRPMGSYVQEAPVTEAKIRNAAELWTKVGMMTKQYGIQTAMHIDFGCAIHEMADIDKLLELSDPNFVGLALDTAELAIAGIDPIVLYEKHHTRVKHFHFKDALVADTLGEYKTDGSLLTTGGSREIERWFYEMGTPKGMVNFPALMKSINQHNYEGWIVAESDQSPHVEESAMLNGWYVKQVLSRA